MRATFEMGNVLCVHPENPTEVSRLELWLSQYLQFDGTALLQIMVKPPLPTPTKGVR